MKQRHPVEERRRAVAREWADLRRSLRSETGLGTQTVAWVVGLAGAALGFELAHRWLAGRRGEGSR